MLVMDLCGSFVKNEFMLWQENLFYAVPSGAMETYRKSIESHLVQFEVNAMPISVTNIGASCFWFHKGIITFKRRMMGNKMFSVNKLSPVYNSTSNCFSYYRNETHVYIWYDVWCYDY